ncbi:MAG: CDP-glycerol glycerophosphotransferase family protein [Planctomycetota bacterium JB042]
MKSVLAYAKKPVGAVMMRPILERLLRDDRFGVFGAARLFGHGGAGCVFRDVGLTDVRVVSKIRARLTPYDLYMSADFGVAAPRARHRVHVFHGVSFRNHAVHPNALRYDLALLAGPYMRRQFQRMGLIDAGNVHRFPVVGMPKLDDLVNGRYRREEVLAGLELDPARQTILYAPTWSSKVSSLEAYGERLVAALVATGRNVLVKLHDNSLDPRKASRDWSATLGALAADNLRLVAAPDIVPFLAAADLLVSDASSVANEFTLLDRPILFMDVEDLPGKLKPKADLETWGRRAGWVVPGPDEVGDAVEHALAHPDEHREVRRALAEDLFHDPGNATDRAIRAILDLLELQ